MDELIQRIYDNPQEWTISRHHFTHKPSGVMIWVANGFTFFQTENTLKFNFIQKVKCYVAFKKWCKNLTLEKIIDDMNPKISAPGNE